MDREVKRYHEVMTWGLKRPMERSHEATTHMSALNALTHSTNIENVRGHNMRGMRNVVA